MAPILSTTAHHLARRAIDPLTIVWGYRYTQQSIPIKIIIWAFSIILFFLFLGFAIFAFCLVICFIGFILYTIFLGLYEIIMFISRPMISGFHYLQEKSEERRERRRERESARNRLREGRGILPGERVRGSVGRNVVNINLQVGQNGPKEGDIEMGNMDEMDWMGGRNMGPLPMRIELPPAYSL